MYRHCSKAADVQNLAVRREMKKRISKESDMQVTNQRSKCFNCLTCLMCSNWFISIFVRQHTMTDLILDKTNE